MDAVHHLGSGSAGVSISQFGQIGYHALSTATCSKSFTDIVTFAMKTLLDGKVAIGYPPIG